MTKLSPHNTKKQLHKLQIDGTTSSLSMTSV